MVFSPLLHKQDTMGSDLHKDLYMYSPIRFFLKHFRLRKNIIFAHHASHVHFG